MNRTVVLIVSLALLAACSSDSRSAGQGPKKVLPEDDLVGVAPAPFNTAELSEDGRTLQVFFSSGEDGCGALDRLETEFASSNTLRVTLFLGTRPAAADGVTVCRSVGIPAATEVKLSRSAKGRTIVDGARD